MCELSSTIGALLGENSADIVAFDNGSVRTMMQSPAGEKLVDMIVAGANGISSNVSSYSSGELETEGAQLISIGEAPESTRCEHLDDEGAQPGSTARRLGLSGRETWPRLPGKKACADAMSRANYQQLEYSNLD